MNSSTGPLIVKLSDLGKIFDVSMPWFPRLKNGDNNSAYFIGLLERLEILSSSDGANLQEVHHKRLMSMNILLILGETVVKQA